MWKTILAQMNPNKVTLLEDAWSLALVDLGGMAHHMVFNFFRVSSCKFFMMSARLVMSMLTRS
jgi:hypothetical protein